MKQATTGDTVRVHYTGTLDNGTNFDSSAEREPIEITIGKGQFFPGLENALVGMAEGDTKTVTLEPENAFGPRNPELLHNVERDRIPAEVDLEIGTVLEASDDTGGLIRLMVVEIADKDVTLDANHPLAGEALTFELTLVEFVGLTPPAAPA
jgi:peptidylprolyl isomerase